MEDLLRHLAPKVLGALARRYPRDFDACEDAVQEALIAAARQWPQTGIPERPAPWLAVVAERRLIDAKRSEQARYRREAAAAAQQPAESWVVAPADAPPMGCDPGDTLILLVMCAHPALSEASQVALTLRAVGGFTNAEIARAFMTSEGAIAQRISRAKKQLRDLGVVFSTPADLDERLGVVLHVLYLIYTEGYVPTTGHNAYRAELIGEAIRLARDLHRLKPDHVDVAALLALMLLIEARRPARTDAHGILVRLDEQDRTQWDHTLIKEGTDLLEQAMGRHSRGPSSPYYFQAAIAALHDQAQHAQDTDWPQILQLYNLLGKTWPSPVVTLNAALAMGYALSPESGLELLATLESDPRIAGHRLRSTQGYLLEMAGDTGAAVEAYEAAVRDAPGPQRRYLQARIRQLTTGHWCPQCQFLHVRPWQLTVVERTCQQCHKPLSATAQPGAKFCSDACRITHYRELKKAPACACGYCGKPLDQYRRSAKFCSSSCRSKEHRKHLHEQAAQDRPRPGSER
jgi:RNA polymerase sigma factor (sigma-70 family)